MRTHTTVGAELLSKSNIPHMQMAEEIARYHHEWWDGTGYPSNLSGTAIPLASRITALADVFDALVSERPYKHAWTIEEGFAYLEGQKGKHFDPSCVDAFLAALLPDAFGFATVCSADPTALLPPTPRGSMPSF